MEYVHEISKIAHALSHPVRVKIYNMLEERGELDMGEIYYRLSENFDFSSGQTVSDHVRAMERDTVVQTMQSQKGEVRVKLKKRVRIEYEDIE
ncbi:MAG: helix-turn-helix domain-containing protein [Archaeoglobaceae archaeon]